MRIIIDSPLYFVLCKFAVWFFVFRSVKTFSSSSRRRSHQTTLPDCLSMNTSLNTYFKYPSELRSRKRKLSPERSVLADITNGTPKRYAVSISNRSTGVTKQFTRMDTMSKREVCAVFIMQLQGNCVYLDAKNAFFMASRPLVPSFASYFPIFHFHFLFLMSAPCIPHPVHNTTSVALVHQSSNP
jgi:hypothetical protein